MTGATDQAAGFRYGVGAGRDWRSAARDILVQIGSASPAHRLGLVYTTEHFAKDLGEIEAYLREATGVPHWVGAVGHGVCAGQMEYFGEPAVAAMVAPLSPDAFRVFHGVTGSQGAAADRAWIEAAEMPIVLVHADPVTTALPDRLDDLQESVGGYLIGGLNAAPGTKCHVADGLKGGPEGCVSGVMLSPRHLDVATGLTQGCSPIGPARTVTRAEGHVIIEIDGRPALDVFKEDIGEVLARDLRRVAGYIFAALPVIGSDTGDYLVRNLVGIDPKHGAIAVGAHFDPGQQILFCRRDPRSAVEDMDRMLQGLRKRTGGKAIRGGLYISCCARGPNQFAGEHREMRLIERALGEFPVIGFFANGEINGGRLYGYTGVLALFL